MTIHSYHVLLVQKCLFSDGSANIIIHLISPLLSEKALVDRACDLRLELENVAADVSGLFSKIGQCLFIEENLALSVEQGVTVTADTSVCGWFSECKDKMEDANKNLVHQFHAQLTQQLDLLHMTVSDSVMQQENQLKEMEEGMQLFVSKKAKVHLQKCLETTNLAFAYDCVMLYFIGY